MYAEGRMQWTTGVKSGGHYGLNGTEALAGINAGDSINHITIPGSQSPDIINITRTSNVGIPGVWMFQVGRGMYVNTYIRMSIILLIDILFYVCINLASPRVAPSNFRVIDTTSTNVTFQWDALSDQQANGVVQQYVITCTERNTNTEVIKIVATHVSLYLNNDLITLHTYIRMYVC